MFEESCTINRVEGVGEISCEENGGGVLSISFAPLSRRLETHLSAEGLSDTNLEREQKFLSLVLVFFA